MEPMGPIMSVKRSNKIIQNPEKRKKSPFDPGRHFPVPYLIKLYPVFVLKRTRVLDHIDPGHRDWVASMG